MNTLFTGRIFLHLAETESTNDFAQEWVKDIPAEGAVILADYQTKGKGQRGNHWNSNPGENLTFSLIFYPTFMDSGNLFALNKLISVALVNSLKVFLPKKKIQIKWPNDILVDRKKICGILIETQLEDQKVNHAIMGIGLNVNQENFPDGFPLVPTSMKLESGEAFDRMKVLEFILKEIEAGYLKLKAGNTSRMDFDYLQNLYGYQEKVRMKIGKQEQEDGSFVPVLVPVLIGVDKSGRLALEINRKLHFFLPKEVEFLI